MSYSNFTTSIKVANYAGCALTCLFCAGGHMLPQPESQLCFRSPYQVRGRLRHPPAHKSVRNRFGRPKVACRVCAMEGAHQKILCDHRIHWCNIRASVYNQLFPALPGMTASVAPDSLPVDIDNPRYKCRKHGRHQNTASARNFPWAQSRRYSHFPCPSVISPDPDHARVLRQRVNKPVAVRSSS